MLNTLNYNGRLGRGNDDTHIPVRSGAGLGNTNPIDTLGSTLGSGAAWVEHGNPSVTVELPRISRAKQWEASERQAQVVSFLVAKPLTLRSPEFGTPTLGTHAGAVAPQSAKFFKPAGQVVLFQRVIEDWGFNDQEAATLLGFEAGSEMRKIYSGSKLIGHRDANDRLRAVLRIAADLDALFQEVGAIRDWLREPKHELGGSTPHSMLTEGSMENLLRVKYYVAYLSGR
jgi:hypothetical protein